MRRFAWQRSALALLLWATAGSAVADDLMQVYRQALSADPTYAAARAEHRAALERLPQSRATLLPLISAEVGPTYSDVRSSHSLRRHDARGRVAWDVVLTQPLFDWSRMQSYEQAKLVVAAADVQFHQAYQALLLRVAEAYFNVLSAQDQLSATLGERAAVEQQLAFAKRNFELGSATITDTHEAQARLDIVRAQQLLLENTLAVQRDILAKSTGQPPRDLARLPDAVALPAPEPARLQDWSDQAESSAVAVTLAQLQSQIAERDIYIARSGHYPTVNLRATSGSTASRSSSRVSDGRPIDSSIGVVLSIPLYSGGGISSQVTEAVALQQRARENLTASRRQAVQQTRQHFTGVTSGLLRVDALQAGERASRSAVEANKVAYEVGVRVNQDVLDAQRQLYATQRDLAQARYATLMAGLRLKAVNGTLTEVDLNAINLLLH